MRRREHEEEGQQERRVAPAGLAQGEEIQGRQRERGAERDHQVRRFEIRCARNREGGGEERREMRVVADPRQDLGRSARHPAGDHR
jgi:hypothetical protein